jgi:hypothetical protein
LAIGTKQLSGVEQIFEIMQPGIRAVQRNWAPFLLIQAAAAVLVVCYYHFETVRIAAKIVCDARQHWGELYIVTSGAIAGSVLPQVAKVITGQTKQINRRFWTDSLYIAFVFAVLAALVEPFYRLQGVIFGHGIDIITLLKKMSLDMFCVSPLFFVPTGMFLFYARQNCFQLARLRQGFSWRFFRAYAVPTLPLNLAFWGPMVLCIYALPSALQFPFSQLVQGAWSLIFVFIANDAGGNTWATAD